MINWLLNTRLLFQYHTNKLSVFVKSLRNDEKDPGDYYLILKPIVVPVRSES